MADNWFILLKVIRYRLQLDTSSNIFMGCFAANSLYWWAAGSAGFRGRILTLKNDF